MQVELGDGSPEPKLLRVGWSSAGAPQSSSGRARCSVVAAFHWEGFCGVCARSVEEGRADLLRNNTQLSSELTCV